MMKSEKGQALPLAILALTVGTLLVAPFLGHASSSVIGSRIFGEAIDERGACDAGVEHAIWRLVYDNLGDSIPTVGDHLTYQLPEAINGVTPTITVTTNASGGGSGVTGKITGKIDTYEFDTFSGYEPDIVQVSGDVYAVAYRGYGNQGYLKTISIAADGTITHMTISTLTLDTTCYEPKIIKISDTVYAIAYRGSSNHGYLKTFYVSSNGYIWPYTISSYTFDTGTCFTPDMINVSGNIYAIIYRGGSNRGYVKTVSIATNGIITQSTISTLNFDNAGTTPKIIPVSGNVYAIVYESSGNRCTIKTINIAVNGTISQVIISSLVFENSNGADPTLFNVSGNIYAVLYTGSSSYGYVKTVSITTNGVISQTIIDTLNYGVVFYTPYVIPVMGGIFITVGRTTNYNGLARTIGIAADGSITNGNISSFTFDTSGYEPTIVQVASDVYAIAYRGPGSDGFITTIGLVTGTGENIYGILAAAGTTSIQAYVSIAGSTASILSWQIS
jgi:hypothetical protein